MSEPLDRTWITLKYPDPLFHPGVKEFLKFAKLHLPGINKIRCPCTRCMNMLISRSYDDVEIHLIRFGFTPTYNVWKFHGETGGTTTNHNPSMCRDMDDDFAHPNFEGVDSGVGFDCDGTSDNSQDSSEAAHDNPCSEFSKVEKFMKILYPGSDLTVGSFAVELFDLKVKNGITDKGLSEVLEFIRKILPPKNEVPPSKYHAEKLIEDVSLSYEKIHACRNDCILYWDKYSKLEKCPTCNAPRYKIEKLSNKYPVRKPAKVLWYFPITPRLEKMYSIPWVAKEMSWHVNGRMRTGKLGHPVDSSVWKTLDNLYEDFKLEPRNVRLGLATDGFNPFGNFSSSYSCWPVMCVPYNLGSCY